MKEFNMALCAGRHEIPQATDGVIFQNIPDRAITKVGFLEEGAYGSLWMKAWENGLTRAEFDPWRYEYIEGIDGRKMKLNLYVTGLTAALIAVLNVCREEHINVTLYHFNRETGEYFPQEVR